MWDETPLDLEGLKSWLQARLGQSIDVHIVTVRTPAVAPSHPALSLARLKAPAVNEGGTWVSSMPASAPTSQGRPARMGWLLARPPRDAAAGHPRPASPLRLLVSRETLPVNLAEGMTKAIVDPPAGEDILSCSVPGQEDDGMHGRLTVTGA